MIYPEKVDGFQVDAGIRIQGGASRNPANSPKHSFRLLFKTAYGPPKLDFPVFSGSDTDLFDNLLLRAAFADGWLHYDPAQRDTAVMLRDRWVRDTHAAMGQPSSRGQFVHVYLNGAYWGVYDLAERIDDAYGATRFGGPKRHYDVIDSGELADGTIDGWTKMFEMVEGGLESDEAYERIETLLDIPNFIDFMIINISDQREYGIAAPIPIFGPYTGELLNTGERLVLSRPADRASFVPLSMADQVDYNATPGWPDAAHGQGASLNRVSSVEYGNDILNWTAGYATPGRPNEDLHLDFFPRAGDANLDRVFNQLDLIQVMRSKKFATGLPATWAEGDWDKDGVFDQRDVVAALQTGNYLQGPYATHASDECRSSDIATVTTTDGQLVLSKQGTSAPAGIVNSKCIS